VIAAVERHHRVVDLISLPKCRVVRHNSPLLYLIGVNHVVQFGEPSRATNSRIVREKRASFKAHVLEAIEKQDIAILAEEFSEEAKVKWRVSETTLEQFGKTKGIEYRPCDPTSIEKKEKGIGESDWNKREEFWLSRIQDSKNRNVLFVCGDCHEEPFAKKLTAAGFDVRHAPTCWRISDYEFVVSDP
jgi:hypothetical protein